MTYCKNCDKETYDYSDVCDDCKPLMYKVLKLDLYCFIEDMPYYTKYDIMGSSRCVVIRSENKEKFLDEMTNMYRKHLEESLEEEDRFEY